MRRATTTIIILATVAALVGWDVYAIATAGVDASISDVVLSASLKHPAIPFALGFVSGHLVWPQRSVSNG